jgi:hypothetical protein
MTWWDTGLGPGFGAGIVGALVLAFVPAAAQEAMHAACTKAEFETVVDEAAASLRELTAKNKPAFQDKLRALKDKRNWSDDELVKEGAPFVKDAEIEVFEKKSNTLLGKITSMGEAGAKTPDCDRLAQLHGVMKELVETQAAKWAYMFAKLEAELGK